MQIVLALFMFIYLMVYYAIYLFLYCRNFLCGHVQIYIYILRKKKSFPLNSSLLLSFAPACVSSCMTKISSSS